MVPQPLISALERHRQMVVYEFKVSQPDLHSELQANLNYIERSYLNRKQNNSLVK